MMSFGTAAAQLDQGGDFSGFWTRGIAHYADFRPPPSGPGPVMNLVPPPPGLPDGVGGRHQGDYTSPILQPWAADIVKEFADADAAGRPVIPPHSLCRPYGLPFILRLNDIVQFLQTPEHVVILYAEEMRARIVHMKASHPRDIVPSYYGHSVGHWDADTLVVDTIGLTDETWTDRHGTPHTEQLHVVERYRQVDDSTIRVDLLVEDPGAFTTPWAAYVDYSLAEGPYIEQVCSENNIDSRTGLERPIPRDDTPDF